MKSLTIQYITNKLKNGRLEKGLTQSELAALMNVPQSYIAKIEAGSTDLRSSTMLEIARLLDMEVLFVPLKDLPRVKSVLTNDAETRRRQIYRAAYEPDEDDNDEGEE